jgi:osmoprotectant transport system substrate-binding protein
MRKLRTLALGASVLALVMSACSTGGGSTAGSSLASTFTLGGPPECPKRPFCQKGLKDTYGIDFKAFKALDAGGPLTVAALIGGDIQVGLLFTSDPAIAVKGFVLLRDDKQLQLADNLVPVVRKGLLDTSPLVKDVLDGIMAKLSQDELIGLNKAAGVDKQAVPDVAKAWLAKQALSFAHSGSGTIKVGSTNFAEQEILGEIFAQALEGAGFTVERKFQLGNREIVYPALKSGQIDVLAEYAATLLEYVNKAAGEASTDPAATVAKLSARLAPDGLVALDPAAATDQNGFIVTKATADKYALVKISDLLKAAK